LLALICPCLLLLVVALATLIYSVESSCRPWLLRGVLLPSVVVVLCVERLKSSYIVLYYLACLVGRLSWSVVPAAAPCCWSYRLVAPPAVGCRACSPLLSVVLSCLLLVVVLSCLEWPPPGPRGYLQALRLATLRRGAIFQKRGGGGADRNPPRPHFYARGQKKCGFSAQKRGKRGEFEEKEKRVRKRE
jgi:hypothetical protein